MIIVNPNAGLCNRMRVINSCLYLAQINNVSHIHVHWEKNELLNATFEDIFQPSERIILINKSRHLNYFRNYAFRQNNKLNYFGRVKKLLLKVSSLKYKYYDDEIIVPYRFHDEYWAQNHRNAVFNTCEDIYELKPHTNFYQLFQPTDILQERIKINTQSFCDNTIGIHIRRTDNFTAKEFSKTELFIATVSEILFKNPDAKFYLSTDDLIVEQIFKHKFGNKILTLTNKDLSRSSKKGIEDAVVDLYSLSRATMILGSYWSSFSAVASWLTQIPLQIVK